MPLKLKKKIVHLTNHTHTQNVDSNVDTGIHRFLNAKRPTRHCVSFLGVRSTRTLICPVLQGHAPAYPTDA